jgi:CheY-like chemotaxis protein
VLYSCGSIIHNNELIIPYAMSDTCSSYATVDLDELLCALLESSPPIKKPAAKTGHSILVVDDDPVFQKIIAKRLHNEGYEVEIASDAVEASMSIGAKQFDVVILDIDMPHPDCLQLMDLLRKKKIPTPVIIISTADNSDIKEKNRQLGAVGYIMKSVNEDLMMKEIKKLLKKIDNKVPLIHKSGALRADNKRLG